MSFTKAAALAALISFAFITSSAMAAEQTSAADDAERKAYFTRKCYEMDGVNSRKTLRELTKILVACQVLDTIPLDAPEKERLRKRMYEEIRAEARRLSAEESR